MADDDRLRSVAGRVLWCALLGAAAFGLTKTMLGLLDGRAPRGGWGEPAPVAFGASVLEEATDHVADLRAAAQLARERWSYAEHRAALGEVDLDALETEALALLGDEPDAASFRRALTRFAAGLHDGHAFALPRDMLLPGTHRWPFHLVDVAEGVMVHGVATPPAEAPWSSAGLQEGDLLLAVDGRDVEEWIREREDFVCASADGARRRLALHHLARWDDVAERCFLLRRAGGEEEEAVLALPRAYVELPAPELLPRAREHRMLDGGVGYFRPGDFAPPKDSGWPGPPEGRDAILAESYADLDRCIGELAGAGALVLDLRGNPGGTDLLGQFLCDRLLDGGYVYFHLSALGSEGWRDPHPATSSAPPGEHSLAHVPLAVLVDGGTFSTADNVAACLRDVHPDVRFVGRPNGAGTGAPRLFELPRTASTIAFCTQRVRGPAGRITEGQPVHLEHPVTWTRVDVLEGRDPDLEAAVAALDSALRSAPEEDQ